MDNNNYEDEWQETPALFLITVLTEIKFKFREEYEFRENAMTKDDGETQSQQLFECVCTLGQYQTTGKNQRKINAKHVAAEHMLRILESKKLLGRLKLPKNPYIDQTEDLAENPISKLFEFLQLRDFDKPFFESEEFGKVYEIRCILPKLKLETQGRSSSKKLAKKQACKVMIDLIESRDIVEEFGEEKEVCSDIDNNIKFVSNKNMHSFLGLRNPCGSSIILTPDILAQLHESDNFLEILDELCVRFETKYDILTIKEKSLVNLYQVLVRLQTFPVICVPGVGRTISEAKNSAALQAIEAINVFTRRLAYREKEHDFKKKS